MCGIKVDGVNHFQIRPLPGGSLTSASASYKSVYGKIVSGWNKDENGIYHYHVQVPSNTTATLTLPNRESVVLEAGIYDF